MAHDESKRAGSIDLAEYWNMAIFLTRSLAFYEQMPKEVTAHVKSKLESINKEVHKLYSDVCEWTANPYPCSVYELAFIYRIFLKSERARLKSDTPDLHADAILDGYRQELRWYFEGLRERADYSGLKSFKVNRALALFHNCEDKAAVDVERTPQFAFASLTAEQITALGGAVRAAACVLAGDLVKEEILNKTNELYKREGKILLRSSRKLHDDYRAYEDQMSVNASDAGVVFQNMFSQSEEALAFRWRGPFFPNRSLKKKRLSKRSSPRPSKL